MRSLKLKGLKYLKGKYLLFDERFVFFPPQIIDILSSIYGEGVKSLLVWLGKKAGWSLIHKWDENLKAKTLNDLVNQFADILTAHGWGYLTQKKISENLIIFELNHNISNDLNVKSKNICYYLTGILSGFGEYALYKVNVLETKCCIENPKLESCEFKLEKIL
jgi:predicted hydrocarbon binding protein